MGNALDAAVHRLADDQRSLWALALASYGLGDLATTLVGLAADRGVEVGPLAAAAFGRFGLLGIVLVKLASLVGFYLLWRAAPRPGRVAIPLALTATGVAVTAWNLSVLM